MNRSRPFKAPQTTIKHRHKNAIGMPNFAAFGRRDQAFWLGLRQHVPAWDEAIVEMNARAGVEVA